MRRIFLIVICFGFSLHLRAIEIETESQLSAYFSRDADENIEEQLELFNKSTIRITDSVDVTVLPVVEYNFNDNVEDKDFKTYLRESYVNFMADEFELRAGKQIIVLSNMDELTATEAITPRDFSRFVFKSPSEYFIGQESISIKKSTSNGVVSAIYVPKSKVHSFSEHNDYFAFTDSRFTYGLPITQLARYSVFERDSDRSLVALDWQGIFEGGEYRINVIDGPDFEPVVESFQFEDAFWLELQHKKRLRFAANANVTVGEYILRTELIYNKDRYIQTLDNQGLSFTRAHNLILAIGLDFYVFGDSFLSIQYLHDELINKPNQAVRKEKEGIWTFLLKKELEDLDGSLKIKMSMTHESDQLFQFDFERYFSDEISLRLGVNIFEGRNESVFGQFDDKDHFFTQLRYFF